MKLSREYSVVYYPVEWRNAGECRSSSRKRMDLLKGQESILGGDDGHREGESRSLQVEWWERTDMERCNTRTLESRQPEWGRERAPHSALLASEDGNVVHCTRYPPVYHLGISRWKSGRQKLSAWTARWLLAGSGRKHMHIQRLAWTAVPLVDEFFMGTSSTDASWSWGSSVRLWSSSHTNLTRIGSFVTGDALEVLGPFYHAW